MHDSARSSRPLPARRPAGAVVAAADAGVAAGGRLRLLLLDGALGVVDMG